MLTEIWHKRMVAARATKKAARARAERAVRNLYDALSRPAPKVGWIVSPHGIHGEWTEGKRPLRGLVELIFLNAWYKFPNPEQVAMPLGYDPNANIFRMSSNYHLVWHNVRLLKVRSPQPLRPPWLRDMTNIVTQFDAPQLALWEYSTQELLNHDPVMTQIGRAICDILEETFGIIAFADTCLLIERPSLISFDEMALLSSSLGCALRWRDRVKVHAVNGILVSEGSVLALKRYKSEPGWLWNHISSYRNAAERVALIELLGWEKFLELAPQHQKVLLNKDKKFGDLWRVTCGTQTIMLLSVVNRSPEPDGSYRNYVLPVDPHLRLLPNPRDPSARMGPAQHPTALNAVASTFGMTGERYAEILGKES